MKKSSPVGFPREWESPLVEHGVSTSHELFFSGQPPARLCTNRTSWSSFIQILCARVFLRFSISSRSFPNSRRLVVFEVRPERLIRSPIISTVSFDLVERTATRPRFGSRRRRRKTVSRSSCSCSAQAVIASPIRARCSSGSRSTIGRTFIKAREDTDSPSLQVRSKPSRPPSIHRSAASAAPRRPVRSALPCRRCRRRNPFPCRCRSCSHASARRGRCR